MEDGETAGILDKNRQKSNWGTKACKPTDNSCKMIILSLKNVKVKSFEKDFISKVFTTYGFQNGEFFFFRYLQIRERNLVTLQLSDEGKQEFSGNNSQNNGMLRTLASLNYKKKEVRLGKDTFWAERCGRDRTGGRAQRLEQAWGPSAAARTS